MWVGIGSSLVSLALLIYGGIIGVSLFGESGFVQTGLPSIVPFATFLGGYEKNEFFGAFLFTICLPLATVPATLLAGWTFAGRGTVPYLVRLVLIACMAVVYSVLCVYALDNEKGWHGENLLNCMIVGCAFSTKDGLIAKELDLPNGFYPTIGIISFLVSFTFLLIHVLLLFGILLEPFWGHQQLGNSLTEPLLLSSSRSRISSKKKLKSSVRMYLRRKWIALIPAVLFPLVFIICASLLPSTWLHMTRAKISNDARMRIGTDAWECHLAASTSSAPPLLPLQTVNCPEIPDSIMRTQSFEVNDHVIAKIYPDVLIFFAFLYFMILIGVLSSVSRACRRLLQLQIGPLNVLQIIGSIAFVVALSLFTIHWYHDHNWHSYWPHTLPWVKPPSVAEKWGRTLGQCANFVAGVLVLPTTRNSVFVELFQVPWEVLIRVHINLGYLFLLIVVAHMVSWWAVYSEQGVFPHDVFAVNMYFPLNFHAKPGNCHFLSCLDPEYQYPGADNWTIPLMNFFMIFIGFPVFLVFTLYSVRRAYFELFYYSHHAFLALFFAMLWHASSSWFFVSLGLTLWIVDRLFRFQSGLDVVEGHVTVHEGASIVELEFQKSGFEALAGQFCMVNVPSVSCLQWHPFSVSGFDWETGKASLHIKAIGDFTKQLYRFHRDEQVDLRIDGPYGIPFVSNMDALPQSTDTILIVCGGIGITPHMTFLHELDHSKFKSIILVWACQNVATFDVFSKQLQRLEQNNATFHAKVFITGKEKSSDSETGQLYEFRTPPNFGCRPILEELLFEIENPKTAAIFTCGPEPLVECAREMAKKHAFCFFREETFVL